MTQATTNTSGVRPLGCAVLVEYYEPERKESLIYVPETVRKGEVLVEQRAVEELLCRLRIARQVAEQ